MEKYKFKKRDGTLVDLIPYVCDFVKTHEGARVIVGCDSNEIRRIAGKWEQDKVS